MSGHWIAGADYSYVDGRGCRWLIGEDENGDLWVPYRDGRTPWREDYLWQPFRMWRPLHAFRYWNSRRRNHIVFLEKAS